MKIKMLRSLGKDHADFAPDRVENAVVEVDDAAAERLIGAKLAVVNDEAEVRAVAPKPAIAEGQEAAVRETEPTTGKDFNRPPKRS